MIVGWIVLQSPTIPVGLCNIWLITILYILFTIEVSREFIRGMFPIKIICSRISLLFFQINPADIYNSEEYVSDSYTTSFSFIEGSTNWYVSTNNWNSDSKRLKGWGWRALVKRYASWSWGKTRRSMRMLTEIFL